MHAEARKFLMQTRRANMHDFLLSDLRVCDVGSLDINGSNRDLFASTATYIGVDICRGKNVDVVMPIHEYADTIKSYDDKFDIVISTEMLEHDRHWRQSVRAMSDILRIGGLLIITCATTGRHEHGTTKHAPDASPATNDYYRNITKQELHDAVSSYLSVTNMIVNRSSCDLYLTARKTTTMIADV